MRLAVNWWNNVIDSCIIYPLLEIVVIMFVRMKPWHSVQDTIFLILDVEQDCAHGSSFLMNSGLFVLEFSGSGESQQDMSTLLWCHSRTELNYHPVCSGDCLTAVQWLSDICWSKMFRSRFKGRNNKCNRKLKRQQKFLINTKSNQFPLRVTRCIWNLN